jgi:hypothetical protein
VGRSETIFLNLRYLIKAKRKKIKSTKRKIPLNIKKSAKDLNHFELNKASNIFSLKKAKKINTHTTI